MTELQALPRHALVSDGSPIGQQVACERFDYLGVLQVSRAYKPLLNEERPSSGLAAG